MGNDANREGVEERKKAREGEREEKYLYLRGRAVLGTAGSAGGGAHDVSANGMAGSCDGRRDCASEGAQFRRLIHIRLAISWDRLASSAQPCYGLRN